MYKPFLNNEENDKLEVCLENIKNGEYKKNVILVFLGDENSGKDLVKREILSEHENIVEVNWDTFPNFIKTGKYGIFDTDNEYDINLLMKKSKRHLEVVLFKFEKTYIKNQFSDWLDTYNGVRLTKSLDKLIYYKNSSLRDRCIIWIFSGDGNNGKTTLKNKIREIYPEIKNSSYNIDPVFFKEEVKYTIFETNNPTDVGNLYAHFSSFLNISDIYLIKFDKTFP